MPKIGLLVLKVFLVGLIVLKLAVAPICSIKIDSQGELYELAESEEDSTEKSSSESKEEFFESTHFDWSRSFKLIALQHISFSDLLFEEHFREISSPPPQL